MRARHVPLLLAALAVLAVARPADASVSLGLGADWIEGDAADFNLTLGVERWLARRLTIGGRAGAAFFSEGHGLGVPIDFRLKLHVQRVYFEGLVGPWILIDSGDPVRVHGAFGFGLEAGDLDFGLEVGVLNHAAMVGARLAFRL